MFKSISPYSSHKLALYIHWPFCLAKCPYCDFNSYVAKSVDENLFLNAFKRELTAARQLVPNNSLTSIFFGGGTPSLMSTDLVASILDHVSSLWHVPTGIEVTLEANPTSLESSRFKSYRQVGINRVSIGIQSLRAEQLQFLGRNHTAALALDVLQQARQAFDYVSADFIYALPEQSLDDWRKQLQEILTLELRHMSLYQLTIEEGTRFASDYRQGKWAIPSNDRAADFYFLTEEMTKAAGLICYEVSNYAASADYFSQHNLSYWLYHGYIGVGPGAHGRLPTPQGMVATQAYKQPKQWLETVHASGMSVQVYEPIDAHMCAQEMIMMGLRTCYGVDLKRLASQYQYTVCQETLTRLEDQGYICIENGFVRTSLEGRLVLNRITQYLCENLTPCVEGNLSVL